MGFKAFSLALIVSLPTSYSMAEVGTSGTLSYTEIKPKPIPLRPVMFGDAQSIPTDVPSKVLMKELPKMHAHIKQVLENEAKCTDVKTTSEVTKGFIPRKVEFKVSAKCTNATDEIKISFDLNAGVGKSTFLNARQSVDYRDTAGQISVSLKIDNRDGTRLYRDLELNVPIGHVEHHTHASGNVIPDVTIRRYSVYD